MYKLLLLALSFTGILAKAPSPLIPRQLTKVPCSQEGKKDCGDGCIALTATCCPDRAGGCPATAVCWLGTNGRYGCCPLDDVPCSGPGGARTNLGSTLTNTITRATTQISTQTVVGDHDKSTTTTKAVATVPVSKSTTIPTTTATVTTPCTSCNTTVPIPPIVTAGAAEKGYTGSLSLFGAMVAALFAL